MEGYKHYAIGFLSEIVMKMIYIIFLSLVLATNLDAITISALESYAHKLQEYPDSDNQDWHRPDFTSVYKANQEPFYRILLDKIGINTSPWSASYLMQLLDSLITIYEHEPRQGNVRSIVPEVGADIVIWGNLQGAFHSFIRDLRKLVDLHFLSPDLKLYDNKYLVFNGNVINGSAYNMQTLIVVFELMKKNPGKVFYIRGSYEQLNQVQTSLYQQIHMTKLGDTLLRKVETFFSTLPIALYVMQDSEHGIRIDGGLPDPTDTFGLFNALGANKQPEVLSSVSIDYDYHDTVGLRLKAETPLRWTLFSSPTGANRRLHDFFFDAFAVITLGPYIKLWTIKFYSRDVRQNKAFGLPTSYNLMTGRLISGRPLDFFDHKERNLLKNQVNELTKKIEHLNEQCKRTQEQEQSIQQKQKKDISVQEQKSEKELIVANEKPILSLQNNTLVVGCTLDLSKALRNQGISVQGGIQGKIRELNEVVDAKLKYKAIFLDDADEPKLARNNVHTLLTNFKTDILLSQTGTQTLLAYLDQIKKGEFLVLFPITGALEFRDADLKNIIHFRPSYMHEMQAITNYVVGKIYPSKCAILYQNDEMGILPKESAKAALVKSHIDNILELPYEHNTSNFTEQVAKMRDFNPDAVAFIGTSVAVQGFIRQMGVEFFVGKYLYGISDLGELQFRSFMKSKGLDFYFSNVVPNPLTSDLAVAKEFRTMASKDNVPIDTFALEGYINAGIMDYVIKHIENGITKQKMIDVAEKIKNIDFGGIILDFNAERRELSNNVWIAKSSDEQWFKVALQPLDLPTTSQVSATKKEVGLQKDKDPNSLPLLSLHGNTLVLGSTMDLSKGAKAVSQSLIQGMNLAINEINARGGLKGGISLKISILDDQYNSEKARANILELLNKEKIDLIVAPFGTALIATYMDLIKDEQLLLLFPTSGASFLRDSACRNIINYVLGFDKDNPLFFAYMSKVFPGIKRVAIFYQNDIFGKESEKGIRELIKKRYDNVDYIAVSHERNDLHFAVQAKKVADFSPDAIGLYTSSASAEAFIRQLGVEKLFNKILFGADALNNETVLSFLRGKGLAINLPVNLPDVQTSGSEIVKEFREAAEKSKNVLMQTGSFAGYFFIRLLEYVLNKVEPPMTREKIIKEFEKIKNFDFKGIDLDFNIHRRELQADLWMYSSQSNEKSWQKINIKSLGLD